MDRTLVNKLRKRNKLLRDALKIAQNALRAVKEENKDLRAQLLKDHNYFQDKFNEISRNNARP